MKVNLIIPPQPSLWQPRSYIPLGLSYLGATLEKRGHEVVVTDMNITSSIPDADLYGITSVTATHPEAEKIGRKLTRREKPVVMGGIHPSLFPLTVLDDSVCRCVITGEAEHAFCDYLESGMPKHKVIDAGYIEDIDALPFPARHLFDNVVDTTGIHGQERGEGATSILSSRGCPHNCAFCTKLPQTTKVRLHHPKRMVAEMTQVMGNYDVTHFRFIDDIFTINRRRIEAFCKLAIKKRLEATWICITRADALDLGLLQHMEKAGCVEVHIGVESGSQRVLDAMNKQTTVEVLKRGIHGIKATGMRAKAYLMYGFPPEDESDREKTVAFIRETRPDKVTVSRFTPLPGSKMWSGAPDKWFYDNTDLEYMTFRRRLEELCESD